MLDFLQHLSHNFFENMRTPKVCGGNMSNETFAGFNFRGPFTTAASF